MILNKELFIAQVMSQLGTVSILRNSILGVIGVASKITEGVGNDIIRNF